MRIDPIRLSLRPKVVKLTKKRKSKKTSSAKSRSRVDRESSYLLMEKVSAKEDVDSDVDADGGDSDGDDLDVADQSEVPQDFMDIVSSVSEISGVDWRSELPYGRAKGGILLNLRQLTLPEALIYLLILENPEDIQFEQFQFRSKFSSASKGVIKQKLVGIAGACEQFIFGLYYYKFKKQVRIFLKKKLMGEVDLVVRQNKLEEVIGQVNGVPFLLDPVWGRKGYQYERVRFGKHAGDIIGDSGVLLSYKVIKVSRIPLDGLLYGVYKEVEIGSYRLRMRWVFCRGYLVPLGGACWLGR